MMPFWCSEGGGFHLNTREKAVTSVAVTLLGGAEETTWIAKRDVHYFPRLSARTI